MTQVIGRKRFDTDISEWLANDEFRDGSNRLQGGRGCTLYKAPGGSYFFHHESQWMGEHDHIEPCSLAVSLGFWERAYHQELFSVAFPDVTVENA